MSRRLVIGAAVCSALKLIACAKEGLPGSSHDAASPASDAGRAGSVTTGVSKSGAGGLSDRAPGGTGAGGAGSVAAGASGGASDGCDAGAVSELGIFSPSWDPLGYPPYAVDGCTLLYVAAETGGGALRRRDLATGDDSLLDASANHPSRPTISGGVIAWERDGAAGREVSVVATTPVQRRRSFEHAGEPRATGDAVVFTSFKGENASDDTDVVLYDILQDQLVPIMAGAAQQRFADISATHVAFSDFTEDPEGYFRSGSLSDIVIVERESGEITPRSAPGKQAFPLLGEDGVVVYLSWGEVHPEPKFSQFLLRAGHIGEPVSADFDIKPGGELVSTHPAYVRPSRHGRFVDFVDSLGGGPQLFRVVFEAGAIPAPVALANAATIFGPASARSFTLVAKPLADSKLTLIAVAR